MTPDHPPDTLDWLAVQTALAGARLGRHIIYQPSMESTNLFARALMRHDADDGVVVLTDDQTRGRGRLGRGWIAPPRSGLTVSVGLRLRGDYPLYSLTPAAALATADATCALVGPHCGIKWPNDVLVRGAKAGGILVELEQAPGGWTAVVGIGLNVNAAPPLPAATCLAAAVGRPLAREPLLIELLAALERYLEMADTMPEAVMRRWRNRLETLGRRVSIDAPFATIEGVAVDVDDEGALLVRRDDGTIQAVRAGDVSAPAPDG